jgi:glutathione synthase/RimK-type ligase-like ATP-grasp enzyme
MPDPTILIVSTVADTATDAVVRSLIARGVHHRRVNTEDFPFSQALTIDYQTEGEASIAFHGGKVVPSAIWYRRLRSPARPDTMDPGIYDFCLRENRAALVGGLLTQHTRWMSDPAAVWRAEFKPYQLQIAQEVGLSIPKTIVSNDPEAIRRAYRDFGSLIVKPARSGHFRKGADEFSIFTSRIAEEHLKTLEEAKWAPSIYQEWIPKRYDIRVTCVGSQMFAAAIHSQTDPAALVDWRQTANPALPHSAIELPSMLASQLQHLMRRLDLQFGCLDLVLTPSDEYIFLEVNPSGQWLWLDDQLDLGISDAVAGWLAEDLA